MEQRKNDNAYMLDRLEKIRERRLLPDEISFIKEFLTVQGADIKNLHKQHSLLQSAFLQMDDLYNNAPFGYHSLDGNGLFVQVNNTELNWLGYSREEIVGIKKMSDLLTEESVKVFQKNFPLFKERGFISDIELEMIRKDGSTMSILLSATAIYDDKGNYKMSRSSFIDLTERKKIERELTQKNEQLAALNHEMDMFLNIASHDLQNPLSAIILITERLRKNLPQLGEKECKDFQTIEERAQQMKELIKNYLNIHRIESSAFKLSLKPVNAQEIIALVAERFQDIAIQKQIAIYCELMETAPVLTDKECFTIILENLLSNAIKFSPAGKSIYIRWKKQDEGFLLSVEDEGPGIKRDEIPLLFEKFKTLSAAPTGGENSTGLGLNIVKALTDKLHAAINVVCNKKEGCTFSVLF